MINNNDLQPRIDNILSGHTQKLLGAKKTGEQKIVRRFSEFVGETWM
jgi:hypothetical protein